MLTKFVKPTRGVVLMPERGFRELPGEGAKVPVNPYYQSLLRFGDIEEVSQPKPADIARPATVAAKKARPVAPPAETNTDS
ncbi:hypothetical protein [Paraburkholderia sp. UCT2]|uniref:hypothetical protein n=1 Tax=Paraburkholderia sp. UCT2 TaxID=2615208 RepID=UPI0016550F2D|nr:hypothetical protein [Paraburkholderia sp. UCT2]MBC8729987.1 hypothetical protein [Paraburkholderia sp. UCT2]